MLAQDSVRPMATPIPIPIPRCTSVASVPAINSRIAPNETITLTASFERTGNQLDAHVVQAQNETVVGGPKPMVDDSVTMTMTAEPSTDYVVKAVSFSNVFGCNFKYADIRPRCQSVTSSPPVNAPIRPGTVVTIVGKFENTGATGYEAHIVRTDNNEIVGGPVPIADNTATITVTAQPSTDYALKVTELGNDSACQFMYGRIISLPVCLRIDVPQAQLLQPITVTAHLSSASSASVVLAGNTSQVVAGPVLVENNQARIEFTPQFNVRYKIKAQNDEAASVGCEFVFVAVYLPLIAR